MRIRQILITVAALTCLAAGARAQQTSPDIVMRPDTVTAPTNAANASLIDRPSEAVRRPAAVPAAPLPAAGQNLGEAKAEMVVGGAAFLAGAIISGTAGTVLMVGGAVVGLYGLWNYLK
jgi:hypothetical protein